MRPVNAIDCDAMPLELEMHASSIILRAPIGAVRWFFLAWGLGAPLLALLAGHLKLDGSGSLGLYLVSFMFFAIGLFVGLQPYVETTFDVAKKRIEIRKQQAGISRRTIVPFSAVDGLGVKEGGSGESGVGYTPQLRLLDGTIHYLSRASGGPYFQVDGFLEQIRLATGLRRLDQPIQ
jgi:hypothetical protein